MATDADNREDAFLATSLPAPNTLLSLSPETLKLVKLFAFTVLGAFVLYILNRSSGKQAFSLFRVLNLNVGESGSALLILADMVVSSMIGAAAVQALTSPDTIPQAVVAGLGMTGVLSAASRDANGGSRKKGTHGDAEDATPVGAGSPAADSEGG